MKILVVSGLYPSQETPGYGLFIKHQVEALQELGHQVEVVANTDNRTGTIPALKKYLSLYRRARAAARHGSYDIVVGHFLYPNAGIARAAARVAHAPYLVVAHGTDVRSLTRKDPLAVWSRSAVAHADGVVAVSDYLLRQLETTVRLPEQTPRATIHMGIDTSAFYPRPRAEARAELGLAPESRIIVAVGNITPNKGQYRLLEAGARLLHRGALEQLIFVGDGEMRPALEKLAHSHHLDDRVLFTGQQEQIRVANYLAAANLVVVPSHNEGLGLVILEALACAVPVAATTVGGIPEILPDAPWGYRLDSSIDGFLSWPAVLDAILEEEPLAKDARKVTAPVVANCGSLEKTQEFAEFCLRVARR